MSQTRRLAAILGADVAGYSRLMGADEEGTLERLKALHRHLVEPKIAEHHGSIVKTTGDGMLVEFARRSLTLDRARLSCYHKLRFTLTILHPSDNSLGVPRQRGSFS